MTMIFLTAIKIKNMKFSNNQIFSHIFQIAVWKGVVSDAGLTWSVEKPMNGVGCTVNYRLD